MTKLKKLRENVGGKPIYDEKMVLTSFYARTDQIAWLRAQPKGVSRTLRDLIDKGMGVETPDKS